MLKFLQILVLVTLCKPLLAYKVPRLSGPVVDKANIFTYKGKKVLSALLYDFKAKTGNQIALLTINSLKGEAIETVAIKVLDSWKLGSEKMDNGLLILVSKKEKKVRIEVGQGLEGVITDLLSKRIIDFTITPRFKRGEFDAGVLNAIFAIIQTTSPKYKFKGSHKNIVRGKKAKPTILSLIIKGFVFLIMLIVFIKNPWLFILLMSGGRGRGYSGGGGFGGYSGGGGGFSGGGASGGW